VTNGVRRNALRSSQCLVSPVGAARGYPGGAVLKSLKRRAQLVSQIGKITGTMKVVASSKLPGAQAKSASISPFYESMLGGFAPLIEKIKENNDDGDGVISVIVYTDKGLCGSTNNAISRLLAKQDLSGQKFVIWGEKGVAAFEKSKARNSVLFSAHPAIKYPLTFSDASTVAGEILKYDFKLIRIVYNHMTGPATYDITEQWLPSLDALEEEDAKAYLASYEMESTATDELLNNFNEFVIAAALNYCHYRNQVVELFQRRNSMENASKNAGEMGKKLQIKFNKARQASITTELGEIVSGAAAVDEMMKK